MKPLGKLTLAVIGLRLFGAVGFFWGMFLGHVLIDRTIINKQIAQKLSELDDNIRIMLPYRFYKYYNLLDGNLFGKLWGLILGLITFGWQGMIVMFIIGHFTFDCHHNRYSKDFKIWFDDLWNKNLGKIFGGIIGFSLKSNILLFVGVVLGFFVDSFRLEGGLRSRLKLGKILKFWTHINPIKMAIFSKDAKDVVLLQSMAGLAAKISKADGQVTDNEIRLFKKLFHITSSPDSKIGKIFNDAKDSVEGYERYAKQIKALAKDNLELQESVIDNLFKIATVDGYVMEDEMLILRDISDIIGLPIGNFEIIRKRFELRQPNSNVTDFYEILGVFYNASDNEIKRRWKELINEYHPDKVQANGGTPSEIEICTKKMAEINNAYQNIMKNRKVA